MVVLISCLLKSLTDFEAKVVHGGQLLLLLDVIVSLVDSKGSVKQGVSSQLHGVFVSSVITSLVGSQVGQAVSSVQGRI